MALQHYTGILNLTWIDLHRVPSIFVPILQIYLYFSDEVPC